VPEPPAASGIFTRTRTGGGGITNHAG
jgi:hypothetical protein